ncbi:YvrJ family protein [uncultured Veillonella sp.]|uniref:YvrJ family protein n=1 Tax=uncultured Veillonella sp. TaxID=159268 RepID=UPI002635AAE1|nr:YvrJ family protein [uncultured Veillonella sp.]
MMEELLTAAANYGFPMVVASYLLLRLEQKMDSLSESITELVTTLRAQQGMRQSK